jgi:hypothetical protein
VERGNHLVFHIGSLQTVNELFVSSLERPLIGATSRLKSRY